MHFNLKNYEKDINFFFSCCRIVFFFTVSCNTEFDTDVKDVKVTNGTADFTKYVALGNSLTSGYRDGALYLDGQNESYPSMIAQQMKLAVERLILISH